MLPVKETRKIGRGKAGPGRPKGLPNKTTALLKDAILRAAEQAGGGEGLVGYLKTQAIANPGPFMGLLGKVLPLQMTGEDGDAPLMPTIIINRFAALDGGVTSNPSLARRD